MRTLRRPHRSSAHDVRRSKTFLYLIPRTDVIGNYSGTFREWQVFFGSLQSNYRDPVLWVACGPNETPEQATIRLLHR